MPEPLAVAVAVVAEGTTRLFRPTSTGGAEEFAVVAAAFTPADAVRFSTAVLAFAAECALPSTAPVVETTARVRPARTPQAIAPRPAGARGRPKGAPSWLDQVRAYLSTRPEGATSAEIAEACPRPDLRSSPAARLADYLCRGRLVRVENRYRLP